MEMDIIVIILENVPLDNVWPKGPGHIVMTISIVRIHNKQQSANFTPENWILTDLSDNKESKYLALLPRHPGGTMGWPGERPPAQNIISPSVLEPDKWSWLICMVRGMLSLILIHHFLLPQRRRHRWCHAMWCQWSAPGWHRGPGIEAPISPDVILWPLHRGGLPLDLSVISYKIGN